MRYQRVQAILEADDFVRVKLSPKTFSVDNRFNEAILVSEEAAKVTDALHAQGKDAHKAPKTEVLSMARKVLNLIPGANGNGNGDISAVVSSPPVAPSEPAALPETRKPKTPPKQQAKPAPKATKAPLKQAKAKSAPEPKKETKPPVKKVVQAETKAPQKKSAEPPSVKEAPPQEEQVPESELPPEQQPLRLPPDFDYRDYPHYSVQSSIYSLLLSALNMSEHYEKFPGMEERQKQIEAVIKSYQNTCDPLKIKT